MRNDANLEKDNTGRETSSANSTTSTITKQTSLCAAALQGVAHPSDGSPELLDDHDCKIALSDHHQFIIALSLVPFSIPSPPPPRPPFVWWLVQRRITQPHTYLAWSFRFLRSSSRCRWCSPRRQCWRLLRPPCWIGVACRWREPVRDRDAIDEILHLRCLRFE